MLIHLAFVLRDTWQFEDTKSTALELLQAPEPFQLLRTAKGSQQDSLEDHPCLKFMPELRDQFLPIVSELFYMISGTNEAKYVHHTLDCGSRSSQVVQW